MTHSRPAFFKQSGAALPVALVMLLISTIIGLSSMRSATQQEKMSSNMYDRSLAYQAAEAALRAAETAIVDGKAFNIPNCTEVVKTNGDGDGDGDGDDDDKDNDVCPSIPPVTFTSTNTDWKDADVALPENQELLNTGKPQYYIQNLGSTGGIAELGSERSANDDAYESMGKAASGATLYRITARSSNPEDSKNRALVVLQATIKKNT